MISPIKILTRTGMWQVKKFSDLLIKFNVHKIATNDLARIQLVRC